LAVVFLHFFGGGALADWALWSPAAGTPSPYAQAELTECTYLLAAYLFTIVSRLCWLTFLVCLAALTGARAAVIRRDRALRKKSLYYGLELADHLLVWRPRCHWVLAASLVLTLTVSAPLLFLGEWYVNRSHWLVASFLAFLALAAFLALVATTLLLVARRYRQP
jgi:hypothetical protein